MSEITLGILGGGQLGSLLSTAAKKLNIRTIIFCNDHEAPAQKFCDEFIFGKYSDKEKIEELAQSISKNGLIQPLILTKNDNEKVFIFNGWTFASDPSLTPFDHAIYDLQLVNCNTA